MALTVIPDSVAWLDPAAAHPYVVVDVFTARPLEGNQLAVFLDGRPFSSDEMQSLAREMKLAETVFLLTPESGGDVRVRIFTPAEELPFAGHPVLGTAFVAASALGAASVVPGDRRRTRSGGPGAGGRADRLRADAPAHSRRAAV